MLVPIEKNNPTNTAPWVVYSLIIANIVLFLFTKLEYELAEIFSNYGFTALTPSASTAFSSMFLHAGVAHLAGNMFFLWMYGDNVEDVLGAALFTLCYIVLGLLSVGGYYLVNSGAEIPLVGASGAISGVLGLYIMLFPHAHVDLHFQGKDHSVLIAHLSARSSVLLWLGSQLLLGLVFMNDMGGVAFSAHVAGLLGGMAIGHFLTRVWGYRPEPPKSVLSFEREKEGKVWCPYCGYQEADSEFRLYECPECGTRYEIVKANGYEEPAKPYKDQSSIDISSLEDFPETELPGDARRATVISEQDGSELRFDGYLLTAKGGNKLLVTLSVDEKIKLYAKGDFPTTKDVDEFLRLNTKFVLSDFALRDQVEPYMPVK